MGISILGVLLTDYENIFFKLDHHVSIILRELFPIIDVDSLAFFQNMQGFPRRLENLENENGHGKVMEHE